MSNLRRWIFPAYVAMSLGQAAGLQGVAAPSDDALDRSLFESPSKTLVRPAPKPEAVPDALPPDLLREPPPAAGAGDDSPLATIALQMRLAQQQLGQADAGPHTQNTQRQIVAELDQLIQQVQSQCSGSCSAKPATAKSERPAAAQSAAKPSAGQPGQPQAVANSGAGNPPRTADKSRLRDVMQQLWGELPEKDRELLYQSPVEEFLPKYETMIEDYYRRLAEEKDKKP